MVCPHAPPSHGTAEGDRGWPPSMACAMPPGPNVVLSLDPNARGRRAMACGAGDFVSFGARAGLQAPYGPGPNARG